MHNTPLPHAADPRAAQNLREDFAALGEAEHAFAHTPRGHAVLAALGGNAPYLADLARRESACLLAVMAEEIRKRVFAR